MTVTPSKLIEITVTPNGETTVETKGFTGAACLAASQFLEQALGRTAHEQLTAAFHAQPVHESTQLKLQ